MTPRELRHTLHAMKLSYMDLARLTDYTPQYIGMLARGRSPMVEPAVSKILAAFAKHSAEVARANAQLEGEPRQ